MMLSFVSYVNLDYRRNGLKLKILIRSNFIMLSINSLKSQVKNWHRTVSLVFSSLPFWSGWNIFLNENTTNVSLFIFGLAALFLVVTILKSRLLLPMNKLCMRLGLLLGMIVSPIVLGVIFFGLFMPIAFLMPLVGHYEVILTSMLASTFC